MNTLFTWHELTDPYLPDITELFQKKKKTPNNGKRVLVFECQTVPQTDFTNITGTLSKRNKPCVSYALCC